MERRSQRLSSQTGTPNSDKHKRTISNVPTETFIPKRTKIGKATPTKSQYFLGNDSEQDNHKLLSDQDISASSSESARSSSEFDEASDHLSSVSGDDDDDDYGSDSDDAPKRRRTPKLKTTKKAAVSSPPAESQGGELWRPGVKAGLGPGTQVVIKKPQARPAGKTPYNDESIHPNTLLFLRELKANNERQWLKMHDAVFRQAEQDWFKFVEKLIERLSEIDETVPELPVKDVIFRIYRDVRFSSDPTPYKAHFSAAFSRTGRKGPYAHYYIQISPNDRSFIGGGLWHPDAAPTAAMRRDIDRRPRNIKTVLMEPSLRKEFLKGAAKNESKAVSAFVSANSENALKTKPKAYSADHPDINLLRLRNYTIGRNLKDEEIIDGNVMDRVSNLLKDIKPFITYLNSVVMPDEDADSSSDASGGDEEEGEESD